MSLAVSVGAQQTIADAEWFERPVGDGVVWRYYQFDQMFASKQSVSILEIDLSNSNVDIVFPYLAASRSRTSVMVPNQFPAALAAVNGTFFDTSAGGGGATTYLRIGGTTINPQSGGAGNTNMRHEGAIAKDGSDVTSIIQRPGDNDWESNTTHPDVMANGPLLQVGGTIPNFGPIGSHCSARHPRTMVGITGDNRLMLVTVDGRTSEAAGMTCDEMAIVMEDLGCVDSLSMDGGGSTTMWVHNEPFSGVVNYPSDNGAYDHLGERSCSNAIAVISTPAAPLPWDGRLTSLTFDSLTRSGDAYTVTAVYENIGTQTWTDSSVSVVTSRDFGRTSDFVPAGQENSFAVMSPTSVGPGGTATFTLNLVAPDVASDTVYQEAFALSHSTEGYFGPPDNALRFQVTVRPELTGAPPVMVVQGGDAGVNNQWYTETSSGWANSSVSFPVAGVTDEGTQRYCSASVLGRSAEFAPVFDVSGVYKVEVAWPSSTNNVQVRYTVNDRNGSTTFDYNQHPSAGFAAQWNELGDFEFEATPSVTQSVTVQNIATGNRFYSGAVRYDYQGPLGGTVSAASSWHLY